MIDTTDICTACGERKEISDFENTICYPCNPLHFMCDHCDNEECNDGGLCGAGRGEPIEPTDGEVL